MKNISLLSLFFITPLFIFSQPYFTIDISPDSQSVNIGSQATFTISVQPFNGYNSTVNFSVLQAGCLGGAITITPSALNYPYTGCQMIVNANAAMIANTYSIIVEGMNGSVADTDTCILSLNSAATNWIAYNQGNSGIQNEALSCIAIDHNNVKWFGCAPIYGGGCPPSQQYALTRFDGITWEVYTVNTHFTYDYCGNLLGQVSGNFLPSAGTRVESIAVDSGNNIYVATKANVLQISSAGIWSTFLANQWCRVVAAAPNGDIWMGTDNNGIYRYDGLTFTNYNVSNSGLLQNGINSFAFDTNATVWIVDGDGAYVCDLVKFDGTFWSVYNYTNSTLYSGIDQVVVSPGGTVYVSNGANSLGYRVSEFNGSTFTHYPVNANAGCPGNVYQMKFDKLGNLWLGTNGYCSDDGLCMFTGSGFVKYNHSNSGFPTNTCNQNYNDDVHGLDFDNNNTIWIATGGVGLLTFDSLSTAGIEINNITPGSYCSVFPNPFSSEISIVIQKQNFKIASFTIFNTLGQTVFSNQENSFDASGTKTIDLGFLPGGVYFFDAIIDGERTVKKIVKE